MFEIGFCLGAIVFILAMVFIPWKCCGRQNIKVAKFSTSTNTDSQKCLCDSCNMINCKLQHDFGVKAIECDEYME